MSENTCVRSAGTMILIDGKKYKGELVAYETYCVFTSKKGDIQPVEIRYARMSRMSNVRNGGLTSTITVITKDDEQYKFYLAYGMRMFNSMDEWWVDKPTRKLTRGEVLSQQAYLRGESIQASGHRFGLRRRHPTRSIGGDIGIYLMMAIFAVAMAFPLVYSVSSSLKPLDELFRFPPTVFAKNPTLDNFADLVVVLGQSWIPFSRYLLNTVFITLVGTIGHLVIASLGAFVTAKYEFPGRKMFFATVTTAMMFTGYVTSIPRYIIMNGLGMIDTYWAILLPAFAAPSGLFMMKQFMEGIPSALIDAAHIDGASDLRVFWSIVMPNVKPAWLTLIIFSVNSLWNQSGTAYIYSEEKKTLGYAMSQISGTSIARTGQAAAVSVLLMIVPIVIFIVTQSGIIETMASSGIKD